MMENRLRVVDEDSYCAGCEKKLEFKPQHMPVFRRLRCECGKLVWYLRFLDKLYIIEGESIWVTARLRSSNTSVTVQMVNETYSLTTTGMLLNSSEIEWGVLEDKVTKSANFDKALNLLGLKYAEYDAYSPYVKKIIKALNIANGN